MIDRLFGLARAFTVPALEQLAASLGTLLFMIVGARSLGEAAFGAVALLWSLIQFPISVFFAIVLLPIASYRATGDQVSPFLGHSLFLYLLTTLVSTILLPLVLLAIGGNALAVTLKLVLLLVTWNVMQLAYELLRWTIIRFGSVRFLLITSVLRWIVFLLIIAVLVKTNRLGIGGYLLTNIGCIAIWLVLGIWANRDALAPLSIRPRLSRAELRVGFPLLSSSVASASLNYVLNAVLTRWFSLEVVGAVQAYRSTANVFGTLSQLLDNHVTAHMVRNNMSFRFGPTFFAGVLAALAASLLFGYLIKDVVSKYALGGAFGSYSLLFMICFFGATVQVLLRPVAVQVRILGANRLFYFSSAIIFLAIIPLTIISAGAGWLNCAVLVACLDTAALSICYLFSRPRIDDVALTVGCSKNVADDPALACNLCEH